MWPEESYIAYKSSSANVYFTISRVTGDEDGTIAMQRRDEDDVVEVNETTRGSKKGKDM